MNKHFKPEMVAPCGLDCNICSQALIENDPCPGCNGPDENKPEFCANIGHALTVDTLFPSITGRASRVAEKSGNRHLRRK